MSQPRYDIDAFLGVAFRETHRLPIDVAYELWTILESDGHQQLRSDTQLLPPEIHFRDLTHFHSSYMGNGFDCLLETNNGRSMFRRALIASQEAQLNDVHAILTAAHTVFIRHGIPFPQSLSPQWWMDDTETISPEMVAAVRRDTEDLTQAYWALPFWPDPNCVYLRLLDYIGRHRQQLLIRNPSS